MQRPLCPEGSSHLTIRVEPQHRAAVERIAARRGLTRSALIREAMALLIDLDSHEEEAALSA